MADLKVIATLIGDVVGSRDVADRVGLHDRLVAAIDAVNEQLAPVVPLRITVGDEYQGGFATVGDALAAALVSRDALLGAASSKSWGVLRDLLSGMTQREIAEADGVSASAVSQRIRRDGLAALVVTDELLRGVR